MSDCRHELIRSWSVADTGERVNLWSCADCGRRFEPIPITARPADLPPLWDDSIKSTH